MKAAALRPARTTSRGTRSLLVAIALLGTMLVYTATAQADWKTQPSGTGQTLFGVSCPTTSNCYAVGANGTNPPIVATTNGGSSWSTQPSGQGFGLNGVSCPSATT